MSRTDTAIAAIQNITRFLWSVASLLAPWLVPIAPATFLGWSVYQTAMRAGMLEGLAVAAAIAAGVGLETVNIASNHAMLHLSHEYEKHWAKFGFSIGLVIAYVAAGIISMVFLDVAQGVRILGIAMFMLAPVAIAAQALTMDLARTREEIETEREQEADDRDWKRQQDADLRVLGMRLAHEEKLARIDANAGVRKEKVRALTLDRQVSESKSPVRQWQDKTDFLADPDRPTDMSPGQLADIAGISERTAYRWLAAARNGKE